MVPPVQKSEVSLKRLQGFKVSWIQGVRVPRLSGMERLTVSGFWFRSPAYRLLPTAYCFKPGRARDQARKRRADQLRK